MIRSRGRRPPPSAAATSAGVDHVRLSYVYLDSGDLDGYGSLLDEQAQVRRPDTPQGQGRAQTLRVHAGIAGPPARHELHRVVADGESVVVFGRYVRPPLDVEFADIFTLTDLGLLLGYQRFYFVAPG
ncbi:nuclear transport factor 2 family protein [Dactylosporangium sp. CA-092794]|uniref:nuclear transport factor 2 family protein n=1 Tax=Dactylosporangium sp. CA-092794 TaxID=3239929 RepID=UPI003D942D18